MGNQYADNHAGLAVAGFPASEVPSIRWKDHKQRVIQERMILAVQMLPWKGETSPGRGITVGCSRPETQEKSRIGSAEAAQHVVKCRGRMLEGERCGLFWLAAKTDEIVSRGICLGHNMYGGIPQDRPWVTPSNGAGAPLTWGETISQVSPRQVHERNTLLWTLWMTVTTGTQSAWLCPPVQDDPVL